MANPGMGFGQEPADVSPELLVRHAERIGMRRVARLHGPSVVELPLDLDPERKEIRARCPQH